MFGKRKGEVRRRTESCSKHRNRIPVLMLGISLLGFLVFYLFPFLLSAFYALIDNPIRKEFVGLRNFQELFENPYFMNGLKNTALFIAVSIPLNMALSLGIAVFVNKRTKFNRFISLIFLIPLVIPSAATAFFWQNIFSQHGVLNKFLSLWGIQGEDWFQGQYGLAVMVLLFLWKNIGYNMALFISGLNNIPEQYYECASVEGAGPFWKFRKVTLTYLTPTTFLVLIMSFVNSFKVFKEIYIITGQYPPDSLYMLQHFMNNMFLSLDYSRLVSAVYVLTVVIVLLVVCIFRLQHKTSVKLKM